MRKIKCQHRNLSEESKERIAFEESLHSKMKYKNYNTNVKVGGRYYQSIIFFNTWMITTTFSRKEVR